MKYFIIAATKHGVDIPGLDAARVSHGASQRDAMESSATAKLAELTAVLEQSKTPVLDLGFLFFQKAACREGAVQAGDATAGSPANARELEVELFGV
jgi:hypothetical protein